MITRCILTRSPKKPTSGIVTHLLLCLYYNSIVTGEYLDVGTYCVVYIVVRILVRQMKDRCDVHSEEQHCIRHIIP